MKIHPVADIFPMMNGEEYNALKEDIIKNGLRNPIWIYQDQIIDGRNRMLACKEGGIKPRFSEWDGNGSLVEFVVSLNLHRRHLTPSQSAVVSLNVLPALEKEAKERQSRKPNSVGANLPQQNEGRAREKAAEMFNISPRTVATAKKIQKEKPEALEDILSGAKTVNEVDVEIKKEKRKAEIEKQKEEIKNIKPIKDGKYDVISIDPPWPYGREYDPKSSRVANPYPEMGVDAIGDIDLPSSDNCVLWLWTTHAFIEDAFMLMEKWGFVYKATLVWNKKKMGMGHWLRMQCEFCLLGIKGKPTWNGGSVRDIIEESRREHSRKPDAFFDMVDELCVGRKLEYFSREARMGWEVFGNDTGKF